MSHIPTFVGVGEGEGWGFIEFPGGGVMEKRESPDLDLQRLASLIQ